MRVAVRLILTDMFGTVLTGQGRGLEQVTIVRRIETIQTAALLRSAIIFLRVRKT